MYDFQIAGTGQSPPAKTEPETADAKRRGNPEKRGGMAQGETKAMVSIVLNAAVPGL